MPQCENCVGLQDCILEVHKHEISAIRRCSGHLMDYDLDFFKSSEVFQRNNKLLEIGFGANGRVVRRACRNRGIEWFGVDPRSENYPLTNGKKGTANDIPFDNEQFGCVFSTHSMEHWGERTKTPDSLDCFSTSIREIYRVLCGGGLWITVVPIGYRKHGHKLFSDGAMIDIRRVFEPRRWAKINYEEWRRRIGPLKPFLGHPKIVTDKTIWNLNVIAVK